MESFKLKVEKRNKLFFNKFKYRATLKIQGAAYTYYTPDFDTFVQRMDKLRDTRPRYGVRYIEDDWKEYWDEVNLDQISQFITWRNVVDKTKCLHRIQGDTVSFFSNDLALLQTLDSISPQVILTQAECLDPDILYFKKEPKRKFRTYFRAKRMPKDFSDNVRSLSSTYPDVLHFSPALFNALFYKNHYNAYRYLHGSYYVEYNDEKMLTILAMWFPSMLAKTYSLAKQL